MPQLACFKFLGIGQSGGVLKHALSIWFTKVKFSCSQFRVFHAWLGLPNPSPQPTWQSVGSNWEKCELLSLRGLTNNLTPGQIRIILKIRVLSFGTIIAQLSQICNALFEKLFKKNTPTFQDESRGVFLKKASSETSFAFRFGPFYPREGSEVILGRTVFDC